MNVIVQKFGGTSVADREVRQQAVEQVLTAHRQGHAVVVVVSAMGRKGAPYATDTLLSLKDDELDDAPCRDVDLLVSCGEIISAVLFAAQLRGQGAQAAVLTGSQAGIFTNAEHAGAQIVRIDPTRIKSDLAQGSIVVVAGFQGQTESGEISTLGRGGSDTTATALGVALDAKRVDIFTDVEGVMTADPRIVGETKRIDRMTYTELCQLAYLGATVIHPRAVEIAMLKNIPIRVRATARFDDEGTLITGGLETNRLESAQGRMVTGIAQISGLSQIIVPRGNEARIFEVLAERGAACDFISINPAGVSFTVPGQDIEKTLAALRELDVDYEVVAECAKVSAVGSGFSEVPGLKAKMVDIIHSKGIEILQLADSHRSVGCLVKGQDMKRAVQALHATF